MKAPSLIVAEKIAAIAPPLGATLGTNLFWGSEPEKPDVCTTCYDTGGIEQNAKLADDMVTVQVRHRNPSYADGYAYIQKIRLALEGIAPYSNGAIQVEGIWTIAPVTFIGRSKADHALFTLNLQLLITPEEAGNRQHY